MAGPHEAIEGHEAKSDDQLAEYRTQLAMLAQTADDYPVQYVLGAYELLFESRDDIEIIVSNLSQSIAELQKTA
ncbi:MAG: hypothetical protein ABSB49_03475 [Polyangia bacterium]|jgi:hypothetical protein